MISDKMKEYVVGSSLIRAMFDDSKRLISIYGKENVYDFSLGNPCFPPPEEFKDTLKKIIDETDPMVVHGYMNNAGHESVREKIAESINKKFNTDYNAGNIIMTVGAAGGLNVIFKTLINPGDEIIAFSPYFGEYDSYTANVSAELVKVPPVLPGFEPDLEALEKSITPKTRIVIVNSPNNPTGVVYSEETIKEIAAILRRKEVEYGLPIYIFSDEPYRELAYDGVKVPYITKVYDDTIVGYSYSKSLSMAGERIGYLLIPDEASGADDIISAATVANRILGFVNAPSLFQLAIGECVDMKMDIDCYDRNRKALYGGLTDIGYECVKPEGAFYLFVKSPLADDIEFCEKAKEFGLVLVPGTAFDCPGYIRLAYCTAYETIEKSMPQFKKLWDSVQA